MKRNRFIFISVSLLAIVILTSSFTDFVDVSSAISDPATVSTTTTPTAEGTTTTTTAEETTTTTGETTADTTTATTPKSTTKKPTTTTSTKEPTTTTKTPTTTTTTSVPNANGELSADVVKRIKDDWMAKYLISNRLAEDIELTYYGTYNSCVVLSIFDPALMYHCGIFDEEIDGVIFYGVSAYDMRIWNCGEFCLLREAYSKGWVSKEDLQEIAYCWNDK